MNQPLHIDIYLDYICPWCYIASDRLLRLKEAFGESIAINWKSFPLDPYGLRPKHSVSIINQNRLRAGREEKSLDFQPWPEDKALPGSSMPAHEAAKCVQAQGKEPFERYQIALMKAYCSNCLDISNSQVLISLAEELHLDVNKFISDFKSGAAQSRVLLEFEEAARSGYIYGVPTVIIGERAVLEAAVPLEVYQQAVKRLTVQE